LNSGKWLLAALAGPLLLRVSVVVLEGIGGCVPGLVDGLHDYDVTVVV
jgi:hypothetical protein